MSTKPSAAGHREAGFERVSWVVLDGMGFEHARRALETGRFSALARLQREGYLGPSRPSSPVCQTPPALLALFTGAEPARTGVWGYRMPDPARPTGSVSGFHLKALSGAPIWADLEQRGDGFSLMNVAFRGDPVWSGSARHLRLGWDSYRLWAKPAHYRLSGGTQEHACRGIEFRTASGPRGVEIRRGSSIRARLGPGSAAMVDLTRGCRVFAQLLDPSLLVLSPPIPPVLRGSLVPEFRAEADWSALIDSDAFRACRRLNRGRDPREAVPLAAEMLLAAQSMRQKANLMARACARPEARLVVGYFPLVDEFNHAYVDLLDSEWPLGRASEVFLACAGLVDDLLGRLMAAAAPGTLLVVSSDHGAMPHRSMLHLNERFAEAGLVRRAASAYDLGRSVAYYHPSGCGQVLWNAAAAARAGLPREEVLRRVGAVAAEAAIGVLEGTAADPFLAFLYPLSDCFFTASPPGRGRPARDPGSAGGHHLSPLSPTPWIDAVLGLWAPGGVQGGFASPPTENSQLKSYILDHLSALSQEAS